MKPFKIAIKVLIEDNKGQILLTKRAKPPEAGYWDVPGGIMEAGETLESSAKREVKEETNLEIKLGDFLGSGLSIGPNWQVILLFFTGKLTSGRLALEKAEVSDAKWVQKSEILKQKMLRPQLKQVLVAQRKQ
jgi:ADP-ribose pyrophosphatase YjhB (NUDIX family)